jgi:uncharacterized protein
MEWIESVIALSPAVMAFTVFSASLLGSLHCAGMCGPLQFAVAPTSSTAFVYNGGRIFSYTLLGAIAGSVGGSLFSESASQFLAWFSGISFSLVLVVFAFRLFRGVPSFHSDFQTRVSTRILRKALRFHRLHLRSFVLGLLTPLLPCGWLLTFLLGAGLTENPFVGALLMFSFCLGTLPVLGLLPAIKTFMNKKLGTKCNYVAGGLFVFVAFAIVFVRVLSVYQQTSCH